MRQKETIIGGSIFGTCLLASVALANPSMLPDHPGHPMKPLESPVTGQSLANDPGQAAGTGEKALEASRAEDKNRQSRTRNVPDDQDGQKNRVEGKDQGAGISHQQTDEGEIERR